MYDNDVQHKTSPYALFTCVSKENDINNFISACPAGSNATEVESEEAPPHFFQITIKGTHLSIKFEKTHTY